MDDGFIEENHQALGEIFQLLLGSNTMTEHKDQLVREYYVHYWYGMPASRLALELCESITRSCNSFLWYAPSVDA